MGLREVGDAHGSTLVVPEKPTDDQLGILAEWLDRGLRRGESGRLAREYPLSMEGSRGHRAVFESGRPVAHAMLHPAELVARGRSLRIGMIGNVYTDPSHRRRGLASACVASCAHDAKRIGAVLALLWSDAPDFYRPLGVPATGRETLVGLEEAVVARAEQALRTPICVGPAFPNEWDALEALYRDKPEHVERPAGALARLASAPETTLRVARQAGRVVGYAAAGRGDDFRGVIHEWAGSADGVLACVAELFRCGEAQAMLASPTLEPAVERLLELGARCREAGFGLARILDAAALWTAIAPGETAVSISQRGDVVKLAFEGEAHALEMDAALDLFFGQGVAAPSLARASAGLRERLAAVLPHPLYVWGFDSI